MENKKLIIQYKNGYICNRENHEINFITIPDYASKSDFYNIDIFVGLLIARLLDNSYNATKGFTYEEGLEVFGRFDPEDLVQVDGTVFLYDLDQTLLDCDYKEDVYQCEKNLNSLPGNLVRYRYEDLIKINKSYEEDKIIKWPVDENIPFSIPIRNRNKVNQELLQCIKKLEEEKNRTNKKDVLLLFSGGKDSMLSAIRLKNEGFHIHFIHFDNGMMLDIDKPYLTFQYNFANKTGYYFPYRNQHVENSTLFHEYFEDWKKDHGDRLENGTIDSEIRCLSCRMAMYTEALKYAERENFKYIAEGARISQKFMLEQLPMINRLKELASKIGIEMIYPVLTLEDNQEEIDELIANGLSSKSWESKCLIGRKAKEKTLEDEKIILDYYDNSIKPKILSKIL